MKTQFIDGGEYITNTQLAILNGFGDAVGKLLVLGCNRKFIKVNQLKKKGGFHLLQIRHILSLLRDNKIQ
jgi:hypothetical protein